MLNYYINIDFDIYRSIWALFVIFLYIYTQIHLMYYTNPNMLICTCVL